MKNTFKKTFFSPTVTDDPGCFGVHAQVTPVDVLNTLPETVLVKRAPVEPLGTTAVGKRGDEPRELLRLGAASQHGAHHGGHVYIPAVIAHRAPAAIAVNFNFTRAAVQTSRQSDCSHLCAESKMKYE